MQVYVFSKSCGGENRTGSTSRSVSQMQLLQAERLYISLSLSLYLFPCFGSFSGLMWSQENKMEEAGGRLVTCVSHSEPLFSFQDVLRSKNNTYSAAPSVATGVSSAFVDLDLTAGPSEAGLAGTGVAALTSVATSGSIHAGLVVSAVVEIWKDTANTCGLATAQHMAGQQQRRQNVFFVLRHTRLFLFFQCFFFFCFLSELVTWRQLQLCCCFFTTATTPHFVPLLSFSSYRVLNFYQLSTMKDRR